MIQPIYDQVFLRRLDPPPSPTGFVIPDAAKERALECVVIAIGPGYKNDRGVLCLPPVSVGDKVLLGKYSGSEHRLQQDDGTTVEITIVRWDQIVGAEPATSIGLVRAPEISAEVATALKQVRELQEQMERATGADPAFADPAFSDHRPHLGTGESAPARRSAAPSADPSADPTPDLAADQYARDFAAQLAKKGQQLR